MYKNSELRNVISTTTFANLYRGIVFKLAFNIPYLTSMYLTTQSDCGTYALISWAATAALYPLTTLKVRAQLLGTEYSFGKSAIALMRQGLYREVVPFLLLNGPLGWSLRPLFSQGSRASYPSKGFSLQIRKTELRHSVIIELVPLFINFYQRIVMPTL